MGRRRARPEEELELSEGVSVYWADLLREAMVRWLKGVKLSALTR
jgi:hypothetical protein